jgi:hypothetical protein
MSAQSWADACNAAVNSTTEGVTVAWGTIVVSSECGLLCAACSVSFQQYTPSRVVLL